MDIKNQSSTIEHKRCHYYCCCSICIKDLCRKELYDSNFSVRLGGLEDSLTYRIYELLWKKVNIELVDGDKITGILSFVGCNFVEITIDEDSNKRIHDKGQSSIFAIDKIVTID